MAERNLTYFVADVHLGLDFNNPQEREARFVSFLRSIPADSTGSLYMLGDIWDFWYEYRDLVPKGSVRVFAALMDLIEAGVKVYFFPGNHDRWCYHYFSDMGIEVRQQPYIAEIGGKYFCLGHGDGLGPGYFWYKVMRKIFRNKVCQRMFSALVHPTLAFSFANGWSRRSQVGRGVEYEFKGKDEPLYKFAVDYSTEHHVDFFIFGHFHVFQDLALPTGARLFVLKDWIQPQSSNFIVFDAISGRFGISQNIE